MSDVSDDDSDDDGTRPAILVQGRIREELGEEEQNDKIISEMQGVRIKKYGSKGWDPEGPHSAIVVKQPNQKTFARSGLLFNEYDRSSDSTESEEGDSSGDDSSGDDSTASEYESGSEDGSV